MKLYTPNNHVVVELNDRYYVIDTGSPYSFDFYGQRAICIEGKTYVLETPLCGKEIPDRLTGMDIAGFIGLDILSKTGFTINYKTDDFMFSVDDSTNPSYIYDEITFRCEPYIFTDDLMVNQHSIRNAIIDTGAGVSYLSNEYLSELFKSNEKFEDESPMLGSITGLFYEGNLAVKNKPSDPFVRKAKFGRKPDAEVLSNFGAFIGPSLLTDNCVSFDFRRNVIRIIRSNFVV